MSAADAIWSRTPYRPCQRAALCVLFGGDSKVQVLGVLKHKVAIPTRFPWASNSPPPEEPLEIGAEVWKRRPASTALFDEMMPPARLSSSPRGAPTVKTRSPTFTSA